MDKALPISISPGHWSSSINTHSLRTLSAPSTFTQGILPSSQRTDLLLNDSKKLLLELPLKVKVKLPMARNEKSQRGLLW